MYKATMEDKNLVMDILSVTFEDNRSVNYLVGSSRRSRDKRIRLFSEYLFHVGIQSEGLFLSEDRKGFLLFLKNGTSKATFFQDLKLFFTVVRHRIFRVLKKERYVKERHNETDFYHVWFVGVLPGFQGQGIGTSMLRYVQDIADEKYQPIYIETSTLKNVPLYERLGFKTYDVCKAFGFDMHLMKRHPGDGNINHKKMPDRVSMRPLQV